MEPLLSICIPTYNRRVYLENTIAALAPILARAPVEIVVSDDASSDDTPAFLAELAAREPRVRVVHQPKRLGGFANTLYVLRAARGRYAVYNADDDRLVADAVLATVAFLEANPGHSAVYAPVEGFDITSNRSTGLSPHTAETVDFHTHQRLDLIAYICLGLMPEHAVYRTASLHGVMHDPQIYWSLTLLDAALGNGRVRFTPSAFYRATYSHWVGEQRDQLFEHLMADTLSWETFRFGLEMILSGQPDVQATPAGVLQTRAMIDQSISKRQAVALDFLTAQARWVEFVHAYRMLALRNALPREFSDLDLIRASLNAVAAVIADYRLMHGFDRVMLVGLRDLAVVLAETLGAMGISVALAPDLVGTTAGGGMLLVVANSIMAEQAVGLGLPHHAIRNFAALYAAYDLIAMRAHGRPS